MKFLGVFGISIVLCMAVIEMRVGAISPRIVGGQTATEGQFPYQISMRRYNNHWCGASLISHNYVLTAAHCVTNMLEGGGYDFVPASDVNIRAGTIHINSGGMLVDVSEIDVHPKYDFPNYDIALLKLAEPLEFTDNIKAIEIVKDPVEPGSSIIASGWGYNSTGGSNPAELQYVNLNAISTKDCRKALGAKYQTVLCATHEEGQGICQGDSGGPGAHNGVLVGVVGFTPGSCESTLPDGFSKLSFLRNWIVENSDVK